MDKPTEKPPRRLRTVCDVNPPTPRVPDFAEVTFLPMEAVGETGSLDRSRTRTASEVRQGYTGFVDGDVLLAKITPCFENGKGALARDLLNGVGFGTTELHVLRLRDPQHDSRWLYYVTQSHNFRADGTASMYGAGGQKRVPPDFIRNFASVIPPAATQTAIANFLDRKTAAIDELIEKKQKLLSLVAEKRAALIHRAVTKGLDPTVPMKDSGIPWIGEIPAHWDVRRLKHVCRLETGHTPSRTDPTLWIESECVHPWVSLNDTARLKISESINDTTHHISNRGIAASAAHLIDAGAVVITRDATIGLAAIIERPMAVSQHIIAWVCGEHLRNRFLLRVIDAMSQELHRLTFGATLRTIGMMDVKGMTSPLPPVEEQDKILSVLDQQLGGLIAASKHLREQIFRIREYRQALITAAVTGRLDIEGAA